MRAARMHEYRKPLALEDVPMPEFQPDEILVRVTAAGMCRTDVQVVDGYWLTKKA
jgi:propanol-preferring alcohol dehydrogenase